MNSILNQYSYVFISIGALVAMLAMMRVLRVQWRLSLAALVGMALILAVGWFVLHPDKNDAESVDSAEEILSNGKPTLVEFYSKYCLGCIAVRSDVDLLIANINGDFNILRVDIHSDFGRSLRDEYDFSYSPEFVLFDATGHEVWRDHITPSVQELSLAIITPVSPGNS